MMFKDRVDAGRRLAEALRDYAGRGDVIVVALPRGGVVVGHEIASTLHLPLDIVCPRKIGAPQNPELAIGAVTETGEAILSDDLIAALEVSEAFIEAATMEQKEIAQQRMMTYRKGRPPRYLMAKCVILVDDGLATGATMRAAIKTVRAEQAAKIIMAVPVAPPDTLAHLKREVDLAICLYSPAAFYAVGQFYDRFEQTSDEEVIQIMQDALKSGQLPLR